MENRKLEDGETNASDGGEMEEKIVKSLVLLMLLINGLLDWKKGEISLFSLVGFGVLGIGLNLWLKYQSLVEVIGGMGIGIILLATAFFTREAIGFGDGLLICVSGIYLGLWRNLGLLILGAVCCGMILGIGILAGRLKMADRVPFVPFLLFAFIGRMIF